ncbi:tetratricopeptide repeat protein [Saccharibacillus sp. O23]|uniref:tetratricopeptide repeat protein n=1 Tax=Saccharibacillus sp. O23 TaxID=2009338 RepID=UPI0015C6872E|nr:tetratricopeptide repeat protein [Saccharibacillus sp. O23]
MTLYDQGDQLYYEQKFLEAAEKFKECIRSGIDVIDSMNYLGCCEMRLGRLDEAHRWFDEAILVDPEWARLYTNKSRAYMKQKDDSKALEFLQKALQLNEADEDTLYYLGVFYEGQGDLQSARKAYLKSLEINPDQPETLLNCGVVEYRLNHIEEAKKRLEAAIILDPNESLAYWNLAQIYRGTYHYPEALNYLNKYLELNKEDEEAKALLGKLKADLQ